MLRHKSIKNHTKFEFHRNVYQEIYQNRVSQKCLSRSIPHIYQDRYFCHCEPLYLGNKNVDTDYIGIDIKDGAEL